LGLNLSAIELVKIMVFWDMIPYILVDGYQRFGETFRLCYHKYGSSRFLRNLGISLLKYMASNLRISQFWYSFPWEPQTSQQNWWLYPVRVLLLALNVDLYLKSMNIKNSKR
jgi:hypothetical protein